MLVIYTGHVHIQGLLSPPFWAFDVNKYITIRFGQPGLDALSICDTGIIVSLHVTILLNTLASRLITNQRAFHSSKLKNTDSVTYANMFITPAQMVLLFFDLWKLYFHALAFTISQVR